MTSSFSVEVDRISTFDIDNWKTILKVPLGIKFQLCMLFRLCTMDDFSIFCGVLLYISEEMVQ